MLLHPCLSYPGQRRLAIKAPAFIDLAANRIRERLSTADEAGFNDMAAAALAITARRKVRTLATQLIGFI